MSVLKEKFDNLLIEQEKLRKQFQDTAQELFKETTKAFFDGNPGVKAVIWSQYTPYWNDGDECTFSVNDPVFTNATGDQLDDITYEEYEGEDEGIWVSESWGFTSTSDWAKEKKNEISAKSDDIIDFGSCVSFAKMIQSDAMEDVMLAMFGNHVRIIVTRDGFDIQDYDHD
jgi:hypothetical protein